MNTEPAIGANYQLNPAQCIDIVHHCIRLKHPTMLWGAPGLGKSSVARAVAAQLGYVYVDIRANLLEPVDMRGVPWRNERNQTEWAIPKFLPHPEPGDTTTHWLINIDELSSAPPMVQTAFYQLILDRCVGEYVLPDNAAILSCGNFYTDGGIAYKMPTPLASRMSHLRMKADAAQWCEWAIDNGVVGEVVFFIHNRSELIQVFDPESDETAFACPRTWEYASDHIKAGSHNLPARHERALLQGTVGSGPGGELMHFMKMCRNMPHPKEVIANPHTAPIPTGASEVVALCASLYSLATRENFEAIVQYVSRLSRELCEFTISSAVRRDPDLKKTTTFIDWASAKSQRRKGASAPPPSTPSVPSGTALH